MVKVCDFVRRFDFKRLFEEIASTKRRIPAAFGLTGADTMLINSDQRNKGTHVRTIVTISLILVSRRTAGGG